MMTGLVFPLFTSNLLSDFSLFPQRALGKRNHDWQG